MLVRLLAYSTIGDGSLCQSASRRGVKISPTRLAKASSASPRGSFSAGASVAQPLRRSTWTATSGCPSEHRSLPFSSSWWAAIGAPMGNHLWQSTLFAAVAGLLTLLLRKNRAETRYSLWLIASAKFLLPFCLLI